MVHWHTTPTDASSASSSTTAETAVSQPELHAPRTVPEVDRRLRLGEALGQVVQRVGPAMASRLGVVVGPLLAFVRNTQVPTTLCVSTISLLGTLVEAAPEGMASQGFGDELASLATDLLSIETARATYGTSATEDKNDANWADDPLNVSRTLPELRRAAWLLLGLLLSTHAAHIVEERQTLADPEKVDDALGGLTSLRLPGGQALPSLGGSLISEVDEDEPVLVSVSMVRRAETLARVAVRGKILLWSNWRVRRSRRLRRWARFCAESAMGFT